MPPKAVLFGCLVFVIWLLRIEHKRNPIASPWLWVPALWFLIMASRPVGAWFGPDLSFSMSEGSLYDQIVLSMLVLLGLWVLATRKMEWSRILKDNWWLVFLYLYLGLSILWSDYSFVSFKRWFKITGTVVMALVVLSEKDSLQALQSVVRRCAYVLIPLSIVLIKYFPEYGVQYARWEGIRMATGVTTHKNSLGILCALMGFAVTLAVFRKWRAGELFKNAYQTLADCLVLGIILFLLFGGESDAYSATSNIIFLVGICFSIVFSLMKSLAEYTVNHLKGLVIIGVAFFILFNSFFLPPVLSILGRDETLTDRAQIWRSVLDVASKNSLLGVGYGGFWGLKSDEADATAELHVLQSHNGYLDVYLQVGIVGIVALALFLLEVCGKIRRAFKKSFEWAEFGVCFLIMVLLYNYAEAGFIQASCIWTLMVFLTVVFSAPCFHENED